MATRIITGEVFLSFPHLHEAQASEDGGDPKFSAALIFPPGYDFTAINAAIIEAAEAKYPGKGRDMLAKGQLKQPLRRGAEKDYDKIYGEGTMFMNVRTSNRPGIVYSYPDPENPKKPAKMPLEKVKEEMYPGVVVKADIGAYAYDKKGNKGVTFGLNNLQRVRDGERIDGRQRAEDAFEIDMTQAPSDLSEFFN